MKRKIIVPVDFSDTSHNAYLYARELAKVYNCKVEIIHTYSIAYSENTVASLISERALVKSIKGKLEKFINDYPEEEGPLLAKIIVNTLIEKGPPVPIIVRKSKDDDVFLMVMGTTGQYNPADYVLGSVTSTVAQNSSSPVLLIPKNIRYAPFENILYASNFESAEKEMLREIINFANLFQAAVHFVHVKGKRDKEDFSITKEKIFNELFSDGDPAFSFTMDVVNDDLIVDGLHLYANENNINLIVLVNKKRGFFNALMGGSETKKMTLDLKYPLMVYHPLRLK